MFDLPTCIFFVPPLREGLPYIRIREDVRGGSQTPEGFGASFGLMKMNV
jgi:hypothetical protein